MRGAICSRSRRLFVYPIEPKRGDLRRNGRADGQVAVVIVVVDPRELYVLGLGQGDTAGQGIHAELAKHMALRVAACNDGAPRTGLVDRILACN